jgi:transcriptional regulator with XRE-family HTH domain
VEVGKEMSAALRMVMAKHQITRKALSIESGLSLGYLSSILNEHQKPSIDKCYLITESLNDLVGRNYHVDKLFPHLIQSKKYAKVAR